MIRSIKQAMLSTRRHILTKVSSKQCLRTMNRRLEGGLLKEAGLYIHSNTIRNRAELQKYENYRKSMSFLCF